MNNYLSSVFFGTRDHKAFCEGLQQSINLTGGRGVFTGDNLFTYARNLSFLGNEKFMTAFNRHAETQVEKAIIWRTYVLAWAAERGMKLAGDFVECGCYKGISARIICDYLELGSSDKKFYIYDLFEHNESMNHHDMPEHSSDLYRQVCERFADLGNVVVTKGPVPHTLSDDPKAISFLHIDMNNAEAELGALERLFDRVVFGAVIVFDDYGWIAYRKQKAAADGFLGERGYQVLELPTGQGLVLK